MGETGSARVGSVDEGVKGESVCGATVGLVQ